MGRVPIVSRRANRSGWPGRWGYALVAALVLCPLSASGQLTTPVDTLASFGSLSPGEGEPLGHVVSVVRVREDRYVVADQQQSRLYLVDPERGALATFGSQGEGPGEFVYLNAAGLLPSGPTVAVYDAGTRRVTLVEVGGDSLTLRDSRLLPFHVEDLCVLDGAIYVLGSHRGRLLHRVSPSGEVVESFGGFFHADSVVGALETMGHLACDPDQRSIYVSAAQFPVVRAYAVDGRLLWETRLPGFNAMQITRIGESTGVRMSAPEGGGPADLTATTSVVDDSTLLVQYGTLQGAASTEEAILRNSVWLSRATGEVVAERSGTPRVDAVYGDVAVSHASLPYPRVVWHRLDRR